MPFGVMEAHSSVEKPAFQLDTTKYQLDHRLRARYMSVDCDAKGNGVEFAKQTVGTVTGYISIAISVARLRK